MEIHRRFSFIMKWKSLILFYSLLFFFSFAWGASQENNFLVISDIHLDLRKNTPMEITPHGSHSENVVDQNTLKLMMTALHRDIQKGLVPSPNFILILGDLVGYKRLSSQQVLRTEAQVFKTLQDTFPHTPLLYVFGNNDSLLADYGAFKFPHGKTPYDIAMQYGGWHQGPLSTDAFCHAQPDIFPCLITVDPLQGFYSAYLRPQLRFIAMNSVLFSSLRPLGKNNEALHELAWLKKELDVAKSKNDSVLLGMHIPPGKNDYDGSLFWKKPEERIFLNLMESYSTLLMGIVAAHTHYEEFKMIQNKKGKNILPVYLTPALSTNHGNRPGVTTFYFFKQGEHWLLSKGGTFYISQENGMFFFKKTPPTKPLQKLS